MPDLDRLATLEKYRAHLTVYEELLRSLDGQGTYVDWVYRMESPDAPKYEGAIGEALAFAFLQDHVDRIAFLATRGENSGPRFQCEAGDGRFVVDVTHRPTRTATRSTRMPARPEPWESRYLNRNWLRQTQDMVRERHDLGDEVDLPRLVFVAVVDPAATDRHCHRPNVEAALCECIPVDIDGGAGAGHAPGTAIRKHIERALFARIGETVTPRYRSVSGFILAGLSSYPDRATVHGGLNPDATHPFDPTQLGDVPFAEFQDWPIEPGEAVSFRWSVPPRSEP